MAEMVQEKSAGLKFAEEQLLRHGWEKGKGLGRSENGISEAIKVKVKCDKGGMGHKEGEQFSFHWWDHVFNKASSGLVVETGQDGVMVKKSGDDSDGLISNKKPRKAQQAKSMLYGCFVKSATLLSGEEHPEKSCDPEESSSSSSSEDEDQKLDLSTTTKLSDADLLKACGGRTAHKGARHGLTMNAKLARLEEQEQQFMNKYGKKSHAAETSTNNTEHLNLERHPDVKEKTKRKKSKKQEFSENNIHDTEDDKPKKTKDTNDPSASEDLQENTEPKKKKRNRKEKAALDDVNEEFADTLLPINDSIKKKKKLFKVVSNTGEINEDYLDAHGQPPQEGSTEQQQTSDIVSKKRRKKKKSTHQETFTDVEDTNNEAQIMDTQTEGQENNRKKKKKRKNEQQEKVEKVPKKKKKQQRMNLCDTELTTNAG